MARQARPSIAPPPCISGASLAQRCTPAPSPHAWPDGLLQSQTLFHAWDAPLTLRKPLNHPAFLLSTPELSAGWQRGPFRRCSSREFAKLVKSRDAAEVCAQLIDCTAYFFCCRVAARLAPAILSAPWALSDPASGALSDDTLVLCRSPHAGLLLGLVPHNALDYPGGSRWRGGLLSGLLRRARSVTSWSCTPSPSVEERARAELSATRRVLEQQKQGRE